MRIIRPEDVAPTINPNAAEHVDGRQVHRRILSYPNGGPATLDVGYNVTKGDLTVDIPYAYTKDEYCYNVQGRVHAVCDGEDIEAGAGVFMWRPAGAATERVSAAGDYISICAFGPARTDGWSHRLPPEQVGRWEGDPVQKPRARFRALADVEPSALPGARFSGGVLCRVIFDTPHMEVSHIALDDQAALHLDAHDREDLYWLESGTISVISGDTNLEWKAGDFLQVRPGESLEVRAALGNSVLLRWSAPAA